MNIITIYVILIYMISLYHRMAHEVSYDIKIHIVLMGGLSKYFDISREKWEQASRDCVPEKFVELNLKAFALGYENKLKRRR